MGRLWVAPRGVVAADNKSMIGTINLVGEEGETVEQVYFWERQ
jgi:hypothetical protein